MIHKILSYLRRKPKVKSTFDYKLVKHAYITNGEKALYKINGEIWFIAYQLPVLTKMQLNLHNDVNMIKLTWDSFW